jgi:hypothetical protein
MHNTPIGPTGAAIEKPMTSPRNKKLMSMPSALRLARRDASIVARNGRLRKRVTSPLI